MDAGDSAAWVAAIVAIVAAVISTVSTCVAAWQAKSAKRSADVAEADLVESQRQTKAAEQAAGAAEQQASEARRQNEITEQQLQLAREELDAGRQRHQQAQVARHVATVHKILLAADALREELRANSIAVIEHQDRADDRFGIGPQLLIFGRAETGWNTAVNKIRVDKPPASELVAAIDVYDKFVMGAMKAIEDAADMAEERRLSSSTAEALVALVNRRDDEYEALKRQCDEFFAANAVDPSDLTG